MAISNSIKDFKMTVHPPFVEKAEALAPRLLETPVHPIGTVEIVPGAQDYIARTVKPGFEASEPMGRGDRLCLDFGGHQVGYLSFRIAAAGSPPDAPAYLRLKFGEIPFEIAADASGYQGEVSRSWIQEEYIHIDDLPSLVRLPRRYAFRYLQLTVLDTSPKYRIVLSDVVCTGVSSADPAAVTPLVTDDPLLARLDQVSLNTMRSCMQSVFEDGPKRDRRLWIADLRLQALTNYYTFRNNDLVKRCLYLFAGLTQNEGRVGACLFHTPVLQVDDTALFDYSLLFVSCLHDYYETTGDRETLAELYPTARRQIALALKELDKDGIVADREGWWCFLDWGPGLNKQAGAHAILIYALKQAEKLAGWLEDPAAASEYHGAADKLTGAAMARLWDEELGLFVSGPDRQISWASQVWFILAGVPDRAQGRRMLERISRHPDAVPMVTPYMYHYYIEALLQCGQRETALEQMKAYWGGMLARGADTFYEVYDPADPNASPYGSRLVNSYCHAWSGTPAYFIRKYFA